MCNSSMARMQQVLVIVPFLDTKESSYSCLIFMISTGENFVHTCHPKIRHQRGESANQYAHCFLTTRPTVETPSHLVSSVKVLGAEVVGLDSITGSPVAHPARHLGVSHLAGPALSPDVAPSSFDIVFGLVSVVVRTDERDDVAPHALCK